MSYLLAALGFMVLIVLHEGGHFAAAKAVGMRVEKFSLFFGPMLVSRRIGETTYGIGPIPLGGFVKISGMNPREELPPEVEHRAYYRQPVWKRIVVIAAGPAVNIFLAFAILVGVYMVRGPDVSNRTVATVQDESAAGGILKPGDRLVAVNGVRGDPEAMRAAIAEHTCRGEQTDGCVAATPAKVVVRRHGTLHRFTMYPTYDAAAKRPLLGFAFGSTHHPVGFGAAADLSQRNLRDIAGKTLGVFARLFNAQDRKQVSSVVGGYKATQASFASDTTQAFFILAVISLSLGLINLFPFLPLDGGHIFWALAEKVRRRPISFSVLERASAVGFALVLMVFFIGLSNDIGHLANGDFGAR